VREQDKQFNRNFAKMVKNAGSAKAINNEIVPSMFAKPTKEETSMLLLRILQFSLN